MFGLVVRILAAVGFLNQVAAQIIVSYPGGKAIGGPSTDWSMAGPSPAPADAAAAGAPSVEEVVGPLVQALMPPAPVSAKQAITGATTGEPDCSCSCCRVTGSRSMASGASTICSLMSTDLDGKPSDTCPASCANNDLATAVVSSDMGSLDYTRFCLMNCLPPQTSKIGSTCRKTTDEEQAKLLTSGGNGKDPESILHPEPPTVPEELYDPVAPPEAPQLVDVKAVTTPAPVVVAVKEKDTGAMVAEANGKAAAAAGIEARLTEAEVQTAQALSLASTAVQTGENGAHAVNSAKSQVQAAVVRANIYAHSAALAAAKAQATFKAIQDIPAKVAGIAAEEAKRIIQGELNEAAQTVANIKARQAGPPLPVPLAEASVRAAKPFYAAMQKAISTGSLYEAQARSLQDQAEQLQINSRSMASQAVAYQMAGNGGDSQTMMAQARSMLSEAQSKSDQAKKDYAVAESVRKSVPNYQANAAAASARATSIANPGMQPPPASGTFVTLGSQPPVTRLLR